MPVFTQKPKAQTKKRNDHNWRYVLLKTLKQSLSVDLVSLSPSKYMLLTITHTLTQGSHGSLECNIMLNILSNISSEYG